MGGALGQMRDIKFRAWHKTHSVMLPLDAIDWGEKWVSHERRPWASDAMSDLGEFMSWLKDVELMQFTGLYDKNGTEIYEGDILRWKDAESPRVFEYIEPVEFHDACFYLRGHWASSIGEIIKDEQELVEVIGNIYEHPELIN